MKSKILKLPSLELTDELTRSERVVTRAINETQKMLKRPLTKKERLIAERYGLLIMNNPRTKFIVTTALYYAMIKNKIEFPEGVAP